MKQKNKMLSTHGIKTLFETRLTQLTSLASESQDETAFKNKLNDYLLSGPLPLSGAGCSRLARIT